MSIGPANIFAIAPELTNGFPQTQTITFSALLITGNIVAGTIAGFGFSVPFNTNNATTLNDIVAAISIFPVVSSVSTNGTNQITITGAKNGISLALVVTVTGGLTQALVFIATIIYAVPGLTTLAQVNNAINIAAGMMNAQRWRSLYDTAQTYLAAHLLTLATLSGKTGVTNQKLGQESEAYLALIKPQDQAFYLTPYGTQYLALRDMLFITPIVGAGGFVASPGTFPFWGWWGD